MGLVERLRLGRKSDSAIADYMAYCQSRGLARNTIDSYQWALKQLAAGCSELPRNGRDLYPILGREGISLETRRDLFEYLIRFFRWCEREYSHPNPMLGLDPPPVKKVLPRVFTEEEVEVLWCSLTSWRDRALIALPLDNGLRLGEIANLRWPNVSTDHLRLVGKVGDRQVPLSPQVYNLLEGLGDGYHVWLGHQGCFTRDGLQCLYYRLLKRAGLGGQKLGPHTLRHTFATQYIRNGGNVRILQEILGHSNLSTTMIYVHLAGRDVKLDHARHSPVHMLDMETMLAVGG